MKKIEAARAISFAILASVLASTIACAPPPLPPQDESRVLTPATPATPEACAKGYWALHGSGDDKGASVYIADSYRQEFTEDSLLFRNTELARAKLRDAMEAHYGPGGGRAVSVLIEPNEKRERAGHLSIKSVRIEGTHAWVQAISGGSSVVSGIEAYRMVFEHGGWFIEDPSLGLTQNGALASSKEQIVIGKRSLADITALTQDVERGAIDFFEAQRRYTAIEQAEIDRDAVGGGLARAIEEATLQVLPADAPWGDNARLLSDALDGYARQRTELREICKRFGWMSALGFLERAIPSDPFSLPPRRVTVGKIDKGGGEITIAWLGPAQQPIATRYPVKKRANGSGWIFVPAVDDPVLTTLRPPFAEHLLELVNEMSTRMGSLASGTKDPHVTREGPFAEHLHELQAFYDEKKAAIDREVSASSK